MINKELVIKTINKGKSKLKTKRNKPNIYYFNNDTNNLDLKFLKSLNIKNVRFPLENSGKISYFSIHASKYTENINLSNKQNLEGITIDYNIVGNGNQIKLSEDNKIDKINIVNGNNVTTINIDNKYEHSLEIYEEDGMIIIYDEMNYKSSTDFREYKINKEGKLNTNYISYKVDISDIKNGILDLTKFKNYNVIHNRIDGIDTLIIDSSLLNKEFDFNFTAKNIKIIDNDDMRLMPKEYTISGGRINMYSNKEKNEINLAIYGEKTSYVKIDKNKNIHIINDEYIKYKYPNNIGYNIYLEYNNPFYVVDFENKSILVTNNKKYKIGNSLKRFFELAYPDEDKNIIKNFRNFFGDGYLLKDFLDDYKEYLVWQDKIRKLKQLGFSNKTIYYTLCIDTNLEHNKKYKLYKGIKEMMQLDNTKEEVEIIEQCSKILQKKIGGKNVKR